MAIPPELLEFARKLRQEQTDAEVILWHLLRGRRFCGFKFRRQFPFHGYILDFYCHESRIAVELDGGGHSASEQRLYDAERTRILEATGIHVVRFWNDEVLKQLDDVLLELHRQLATRTEQPPSPGAVRHPLP